MDFSKYKTNVKTNKIFNGETLSYTLSALFSVFLLIAFKQLLKVFFSVPVSISVFIAFIIAEIVSFLLEKRFVFRKSVLSSNVKQILMFVFRAAVDFGFYKLAEAAFGNMLKMPVSFVWLVAITTAFFFNYFFDRLLLFDCNYKAEEIRHSKIYLLFYSNRYVFLSAGIAALCITIIYIVYSVFPFGDYTVMRMDLYHQYGPLFAELYERVVSHQSFLYSWFSGGGSSFLGNYFNYLSSPLSALIFLFDKKDISFAITFIVSVKCILSAGTFSYYLKASQKKSNALSAVFGVLYAFSAYFLAYYWNVMWLDGMILLPLIALGIEKIINEGKSGTYIISFVILFFSSYYMGFMMCIFAVIYFLGYYLISSKFNDKIDNNAQFEKKYSFKALLNNKFFNRGFRFAIGSIAAAGVCAFTLVPVFMILRSSSATSDSFPNGFSSYYNIFDFLTSHLAGLETTIRSSGDDVLPNVYSGMLAVILLPLFVINKDIRFKEKAACILMLILFLFSFNNNCLNFIWHAFHFPNDLPFRFSYMYSFLLLVCGYRCVTKLKSISIRDIGLVGMAWVFFVVIAQKMATTKMSETTIYISIAFIILWTAFLYLLKNRKLDKMIVTALAIVMVFSEVLIADTGSILITQENGNYSSDFSNYDEAIDEIHSSDDGFYREELTYLETRMDPSYYGYNGMSVFSSMAYEDYSQLQYSLGMFGNRINSYTYNTQTPVYNMMFNLKYLIKADVSQIPSENLYSYSFSTADDKTAVYENRYFLPISFAVNTNTADWYTEEGNPFEVQNSFFNLATGYDNVFNEVDYLTTDFDSMSGDEITQNGTFWFSKNGDDSYGYVDFVFTPKESGNTYLYVTSPEIELIEINSNNLAGFTQSIGEPYILDIGFCEEGEEIKISLDCTTIETTDTYAEIYAYTVDEDVLKLGYDRLSNSALNVTSHNDTNISGTVQINEDSILYSSIPYDEGWSILIDGEKADTFALGDVMLATYIKPGDHTVEYKYSPRGLNLGIIISAASIAGICGYITFVAFNKKRKANLILESDIQISETE
ncbi:MAG: YfhO family protein [Eubacterium sp.]|nr:YfhO family protein [Eubacterium sp.]